jgi:phospholipid/cholesterol/gamma-HCH transport system permease protein
MQHPSQPASIQQPTPLELQLAGCWDAQYINAIEHKIASIQLPDNANVQADCAEIITMDTVGAWCLQKLLQRATEQNTTIHLNNLSAVFKKRLDIIGTQFAHESGHQSANISKKLNTQNDSNFVEQIGKKTVEFLHPGVNALSFVGETAIALAKSIAQPNRIRWRPILFNIRTAGFDALPIVGLLSFLLGVVVAYQGAGQLKQYGANIFVADLVGLSMLREFAPLITAIIIAGRSGSAYAAQIGTMAVTEEIDAMQTLGISPQELLVIPKIIALVIALPLLTVFADILGVFGGMLMAYQQLDVGFMEFLDRFVKAVSPTAFLVGVGKAPIFATIIAMVGCYQGFRTKGGADSVGRQTTRSVVQSIFLVIVADAVFSVAFSMLNL